MNTSGASCDGQFQGLRVVSDQFPQISRKIPILILILCPQQVSVTVVLVKLAPVLQPVQVSKPVAEIPLTQNCISNEFIKHLHFHRNLMLFHLIKDCTILFPQSLMSQSITDTLWNIWNPLESPRDHCWIPQPCSIGNYTQRHRNFWLFHRLFFYFCRRHICTKWRILILAHKTPCSFLPRTFMIVCSFTSHVLTMA